MTKYREILRLKSLGFSEGNIALSVPCSRNTVSKVLKRVNELNLSWSLTDNQTNTVIERMLYPKHRATMHINKRPSEQVKVDWAGNTTKLTEPDTGEIVNAYIFVGVMTYSQYTYVDAFLDMKQAS